VQQPIFPAWEQGGSHILRGEVRAKEPGIGRKKAEETPGPDLTGRRRPLSDGMPSELLALILNCCRRG